MKSFYQIYAQLRRKNYKNYLLLAGCCLFSVLLITAYVLMMRSRTVLTVLPEGGDSRKQVMMIFVLAVIGCGVFTMYASSLFFRYKSREFGLFLALGASRQQLRGVLMREITVLSVSSCIIGTLLSIPTAWIIWRFFRLAVVDSQEMILSLDIQALFYALLFSVFVIFMLFFMTCRFIRRTNIMDVLREQHKAEPIQKVPHWYGMAGIGLMLGGGLLGYQMPGLLINMLHWYPPDVLSLAFYVPLFIGLYMILLHTVVNGWRGGKHYYQNLISVSMMKFQGRQTVRNMLVVTVLIAGGFFAMFYSPMLGTGAMMEFDQRQVDYAFHGPVGLELPTKNEVENIANEMGVKITSWAEQPSALLGVDGWAQVETDGALGTTYTEEYRELLSSELFFSESAYRALTGRNVTVEPGEAVSILTDDGDNRGIFNSDITLITNTVTGKTLPVTCLKQEYNSMLLAHFILDDVDYLQISNGLTEQWLEKQVFFNVENVEATYPFAKRLFHEIVDRANPEYALYDAYDPIVRKNYEDRGEKYFLDPQVMEEYRYEPIRYQERDSSNFRLNWKYMPQFRVLDKADFIKTLAVFLMLFVFIALVCMAAVVVIVYTRCITIALTNTLVFEDLKRLGAGPQYLRRAARGQVSRVFVAPAITGTGMIFSLYLMILYFNDSRFSQNELAGIAVCIVLVIIFLAVFYGIYRLTLKRTYKLLRI